MRDKAYQTGSYDASEIEHRYGDRVHILKDPLGLSLLAKLCTQACVQPEISQLIRMLYRRLIHEVVNACFPRSNQRLETRMIELSDRGVLESELLDPQTPVVSVDIARAGTLPSQVCYEYLNHVLNPEVVRQDHLIMSRVTDDQQRVTGAIISGDKVGGPIDGRIVLFPDPMGATGSSLSKAITYMKESFGGSPAQLITLNLIVTPQFIRRLTDDHPDVQIYVLRLDRGMSNAAVLDTIPGERWSEELGLTDTDYIVPGGGGFGEIMNNAFV
jgi:uracil phosphoribosyltransferase